MTRREVVQSFAGETLTHVLVHDASGIARPGIVTFPTVMGVADLELRFAEDLVALGYSVMVADLYGRRFTPAEREAAFAAMGALRGDRESLRDRLLAVLDVAVDLAEVDARRVGVTGYCFGGMCALDLARSGADVAAVASFHGLFDPPPMPPVPIRARVLAMHGWNDPMVPPEAVVALARELTAAGSDWQIHAYGHTGHGFTNPAATGAVPGVKFDAAAARRSWAALEDFLAEALA